MPSPKISKSLYGTGVLTLGSFRNGADFFQTMRSLAFGSVESAYSVETLNAPMPVT